MREPVNDSILAIAARFSGVRLWRQNTGVGYGLSVVKRAVALRSWDLLKRARPITFGVPGQADVSGILPEGRRLEIELKSQRDVQREAQKRFQHMIESSGGVYILARSADDACDAVEQAIRGDREASSRDRDIIRWMTYRSSQGHVGLCEEMYELEVAEGQWEPEED